MSLKELTSAVELLRTCGGPSVGEILDQHVKAINEQHQVIQQQAAQLQALQTQISALSQQAASAATRDLVVAVVVGLAAIALAVVVGLYFRRLEQRLRALELMSPPRLPVSS